MFSTGGYWGPHVGYYGGVNYGFGYMGIGFVGGAWRGHEFAYNTAVVRVNETVIHNTYVDRNIVERNTVVRDSRVAYSGGPGGINHQPTGEERGYMHESHMAPTGAQQAHVQAARVDHSSYFNANHGQPQHAAFARPVTSASRPGGFNGNGGWTWRLPRAAAVCSAGAEPVPSVRTSAERIPAGRAAEWPHAAHESGSKSAIGCWPYATAVASAVPAGVATEAKAGIATRASATRRWARTMTEREQGTGNREQGTGNRE